jgi:hypothetical protein
MKIGGEKQINGTGKMCHGDPMTRRKREWNELGGLSKSTFLDNEL